MNSTVEKTGKPRIATMIAGLCLATIAIPISSSRAQELAGEVPPPPTGPVSLEGATEAQAKQAWKTLQQDAAELEATDPAAAVTRYQLFFENGANRFPSVAVQIALRIARIWQLDLVNYDKAIEIYDWALATYKDQPESIQLQKGRLSAVQAQARAEAARGEKPVADEKKPTGNSLAVTIGKPTDEPPLSLKVPLSGPIIGMPKIVATPNSTESLAVVSGTPAISKSSLDIAVAHLSARGNALGWQPGRDRCVTALAKQANGRLWVATEDSGVWSCDPTAPLASRWKQFNKQNGLNDNSAYALAIDAKERVWVGTLGHGVSVWNGQEWGHYDVLEGPIGERVFDIAVCPTDGDVWIATNAGLSRYSVARDSWSTYTSAEGLPSNEIQTVAFDSQGNILVGTQYRGLALARADKAYKSWQLVTGPDQMPLTASGSGLPSNCINDVLVSHQGTYYVATPRGLAWSDDKGLNWKYVRGKDYAAKVRGRFGGPPQLWKEQKGAILAEDYINCLAEDNSNRLWLGYWQQGNEVLETRSQAGVTLQAVIGREENEYVRAILPQDQGSPLLARYDLGIGQSGFVAQTAVSSSSLPLTVTPPAGVQAMKLPATDVGEIGDAKPQELPRLPTASIVTQGQLDSLLREIEAVPDEKDSNSPFVSPLPSDWKTEGDWLGRYGRYWACLCAYNAPSNYIWGAGRTKVDYNLQISPQMRDDSLRYWVHWLYTSNTRSLEMPAAYAESRVLKRLGSPEKMRRQSEIDDHGETYPMTQEGPNIYASLLVPKGLFTLSLYNHNKDGEAGLNRQRDYIISVRRHPDDKSIEDVRGFETWPELAQTRLHDFRGGVYTKFMVRGPQKLTIEINRNHSVNAILAGVFLDEVNEQPSPYFSSEGAGSGLTADVRTNKQELPAGDLYRLGEALEKVKQTNPRWWLENARRYYIVLGQLGLKSVSDETRPAGPLDALSWKLLGSSYANLNAFPLWEESQHKRGLLTARDLEKSLHWDQVSNYSGHGHEKIAEAWALFNGKKK